MKNIIEKVTELGELIKADERSQKLSTASAQFETDFDLNADLEEYEAVRTKLYASMQKEDKNEEEAAKLNNDMRTLYDKISTNKNYVNYSEAKQNFDAMMQEVFDTLQFVVTGQEPESSCGSGGCSSCSGCK